MQREHRTAVICLSVLQPDCQSWRSSCLKVLSIREFISHGALSASVPPPTPLPLCLLNKMLNSGHRPAPSPPAPPHYLQSVLKSGNCVTYPSIRLTVVAAGNREGFPEPGAVTHPGPLTMSLSHAPHPSRNKSILFLICFLQELQFTSTHT